MITVKKEKLFIFGGIMLKKMNKGKNSTCKYITQRFRIKFPVKNLFLLKFYFLTFT
ncbi:hypothetical protein SAMN02745135_01437 [Caloranaerobacter azorensis DSM 13643]|uniref:Uncharacterized protein n=1 Tax=Caloranaerobacter azorensis DSM 13643 TaxID=1121264 RepID=A0A1M5UIC3_9FIRM|nr:hypothetical protein SAMN02745135_01437 [Caloranaerobacter azorensis DSM 13643]